jgi:hypothetical protein
MREFTVNLKMRIGEWDYQELRDSRENWTLNSELQSWFDDLGFDVLMCDVSERIE